MKTGREKKQAPGGKLDAAHEAARPYGGGFPKSGKSRLSSQGQVTIPKEIREYLKLTPGDEVWFAPRGDEVIIRAKRKGIDHLLGMLAEYAPAKREYAREKSVTDDEITDAWARAAVERYESTLDESDDDSD